jgi:hypothetical protein
MFSLRYLYHYQVTHMVPPIIMMPIIMIMLKRFLFNIIKIRYLFGVGGYYGKKTVLSMEKLEVASRSSVSFFIVAVGEGILSYPFPTPGCVDKCVSSYIDAHMRHSFARYGKEDEVTL